jgi:hypothetical protein
MTNTCIGCYVQTLATKGFNESLKKIQDLPLDNVFRVNTLQDLFNKKIQEVLDERPETRSLWAWAVSSFDGEEATKMAASLMEVAFAILGDQAQDGSWGNSDDSNRPYSEREFNSESEHLAEIKKYYWYIIEYPVSSRKSSFGVR